MCVTEIRHNITQNNQFLHARFTTLCRVFRIPEFNSFHVRSAIRFYTHTSRDTNVLIVPQPTDFSSSRPAVEVRRGIRCGTSVFSRIHRGCFVFYPSLSNPPCTEPGQHFYTILVTSRLYSEEGKGGQKAPLRSS
jgi:hypothetical protein